MKASELAEILHFDVCPACHDIMPTDLKLRDQMHGLEVQGYRCLLVKQETAGSSPVRAAKRGPVA